MIARRVAWLGSCVLLCGCANLLPRGDSERLSGFDSFEGAAQAFGARRG